MDQDQSWSRGRHSSWSNDGRESGSPSPRRTHHSGSPSHKFKPSKPVWDVSIELHCIIFVFYSICILYPIVFVFYWLCYIVKLLE